MVEPISFVLLSFVADKVFNALADNLAGNVADNLMSKLRGDPAKKAFGTALGTAVQQYATGIRLALAGPLLNNKGILADPDVAKEISQIIIFSRQPNTKLIGDKWKVALANPPKDIDFTEEAKLLLKHIENELRNSEVFRPVLEAKDLNMIATKTDQSTESLENIERQLGGLATLLDAGFIKLLDAFMRSSYSIRDQIRDYNLLIDEKTRGFVGRQWVFNAFDRFIKERPRGYFFIIGDPGIGKSALSAQMVKQNGYVHHFNIRSEGINKSSTFLRNICAQIIAAYDLAYPALPPETTEDAGFFNKLLVEVSRKLRPVEKCVIVIDALDEVDSAGIPFGANLLYLPLTIPNGIYIVATMREDEQSKIRPRVDCEFDELKIKHDSSDNLKDIADYIQASIARPGIQAYIKAQSITLNAVDFVELMVDKSEGNFMYLRYVLPEIERGAYKDFKLDDIPKGLEKYYEDHWKRMRGQDETAWFEYKLPVIVALTMVKEQVPIDILRDFSKVNNKTRIREVLREWAPFLHTEKVEKNGKIEMFYRLYHASFFDFIAKKEEVADERVDLKAMREQIPDIMCRDWLGITDDD